MKAEQSPERRTGLVHIEGQTRVGADYSIQGRGNGPRSAGIGKPQDPYGPRERQPISQDSKAHLSLCLLILQNVLVKKLY